jgi:glycerol kinase
MQLQANVLRRPLSIAASDSMTPYGAALMAGLGSGLWGSLEEIKAIARPAERIVPDEGAAAALDRTYASWLKMIDRLIAMEKEQTQS